MHFYWKNDDESLDLTFDSDMFGQLKTIIMKKIFSIAAIALVAMTFASCEKSYTCDCTTTTTGTDPITGLNVNSSQVVSQTADMKKKDSEDWCAKGNANSSSLGYTVTVSCKLR